MIAIVTGSFDNEAGSFYLGGAGFLILFYATRSFFMLQKTDKIDGQKLNGFDRLCGYIGMINGFIFLALGIIVLIISFVQLKFPSLGEVIVLIVCSIYGYSMLYYIRQSLKKLS